MKIKTSELIDGALDWAVAKCEGRTDVRVDEDGELVGQDDFDYSTDWSQGGSIIEREGIDILKLRPRYKNEDDRGWRAYHTPTFEARTHTYAEGPTPLIAAMRCYVASKMGDEVDVPDELLQQSDEAQQEAPSQETPRP